MVYRKITERLIKALTVLLYKLSPIQKMATVYRKPPNKFTKSGLLLGPGFFFPNGTIANFFISVLNTTPASRFQLSTDFEAVMLFALTDKTSAICSHSLPRQITEHLKCWKTDGRYF